MGILRKGSPPPESGGIVSSRNAEKVPNRDLSPFDVKALFEEYFAAKRQEKSAQKTIYRLRERIIALVAERGVKVGGSTVALRAEHSQLIAEVVTPNQTYVSDKAGKILESAGLLEECLDVTINPQKVVELWDSGNLSDEQLKAIIKEKPGSPRLQVYLKGERKIGYDHKGLKKV